MEMLCIRNVVLTIVTVFTLAGCHTAPPLNLDRQPIGMHAQGDATGVLIERALNQRGWTVAARRPGAIDAFILVRQHRADITISYDAETYSILFRDGDNLSQWNGRVHRNYNGWIVRLNNEIQQTLGAAPRT